MSTLSFLKSYITWHYSAAIPSFLRVWENYIVFCVNFFSLKELFRTLFSPWHRLHEEYPKGFDIEETLSTFVINVLMRLVGVAVRIMIIVVGLVAIIIVSGVGVIGFALWMVYPFVIGMLAALTLFTLFA